LQKLRSPERDRNYRLPLMTVIWQCALPSRKSKSLHFLFGRSRALRERESSSLTRQATLARCPAPRYRRREIKNMCFPEWKCGLPRRRAPRCELKSRDRHRRPFRPSVHPLLETRRSMPPAFDRCRPLLLTRPIHACIARPRRRPAIPLPP